MYTYIENYQQLTCTTVLPDQHLWPYKHLRLYNCYYVFL